MVLVPHNFNNTVELLLFEPRESESLNNANRNFEILRKTNKMRFLKAFNRN